MDESHLDAAPVPDELLDEAEPVAAGDWWPTDDADAPSWRPPLLGALVDGWAGLSPEARRTLVGFLQP